MENLATPLSKGLSSNKLNWIFMAILLSSVLLGVTAGILVGKGPNQITTTRKHTQSTSEAKTPQADIRTFRDFAKGVIKIRPEPKIPTEYVEGTHLLIREGAVPVALTSSVVDLTQFEGKKVKVFGETQKAVKEGWLMDVGKIETDQ